MVGGYGLNLTSANVVIMFDHDYNPTVDMQAIDRAHRLGQKNILNVFRLITKNTLEEKIMGIQRFKTNLANAIVNIDNASIKNIEESRLPDLLEKVVQMEKAEPKVGKKLSKSFYSTLLKEMEEEIQAEDYDKQY
jgi:TATA-binding protein-associated factor